MMEPTINHTGKDTKRGGLVVTIGEALASMEEHNEPKSSLGVALGLLFGTRDPCLFLQENVFFSETFSIRPGNTQKKAKQCSFSFQGRKR